MALKKNSERRVLNWFLDLLFPKACFGCGKEGEWLCAKCYKKIKFAREQVCPVCDVKNLNGRVCAKCRPKTSLDGLIRAVLYQDCALTKSLLHAYKYKFVAELNKDLSKIILEVLPRSFFSLKNYQLSFVPIAGKRLKERGFNQAELLAREIASFFNLEVVDFLERTRFCAPQMELNRSERLKNLKNVFRLKKGESVAGKRIVIVDDVATTLATLNENAKVLKEARAKEVYGLVVARDT